jgi:aspartate kinase
LKFGGAAVASAEQFSRIAQIIIGKAKSHRVVVVVSAMGDTTDQLLALARTVHPEPPLREQDMLISVGERISISLLAMALHLHHQEAISFTGSQSGIITTSTHSDARIIAVKPDRLLRALSESKVAIVAGFQGVSRNGEITTLGRGGSDTTAVALGIALNASCVEFYKDVDGVYGEDPKVNLKAELFSSLSYERALQLVEKGAQVLHPRCVRLAQANGLPLCVRSFLSDSPGTLIPGGERQEKSLNRFVYEST